MKPYEVELSPAATRDYRKLPDPDRARVRTQLKKLASDASLPGRIEGKSVKTIKGVADTFHRLRVGDYRVMYDVLEKDRVILVLGIVDRSRLERWLKNR